MRLPVLCLLLACAPALRAQDAETPPIVITSPDDATTFAFGSVKEHSLIWDKKSAQLMARIVFVDEDRESSQSDEDLHFFRLPGVSFDATKGIFYATSAKGEIIPVAHLRHQLFVTAIQTLPNAVVRIQHPRGRISVILEALEPNDPALTAKHGSGSETNSEGHGSIEIPGFIH